jgi:hypothetical protein
MSESLCVICGKGQYQPDEQGGYIGMRDVLCACGDVHRVCKRCWTNPGSKVLAEAFSWDSKTWMGDAKFDVCPKDILVAWRLMG